MNPLDLIDPPATAWPVPRTATPRALPKDRPAVTFVEDARAMPSDKPKPALDDGWIAWHGGEGPPAGEVVAVKFRGGIRHDFGIAGVYVYWDHRGLSCDIIAYKLAKPDRRDLLTQSMVCRQYADVVATYGEPDEFVKDASSECCGVRYSIGESEAVLWVQYTMVVQAHSVNGAFL